VSQVASRRSRVKPPQRKGLSSDIGAQTGHATFLRAEEDPRGHHALRRIRAKRYLGRRCPPVPLHPSCRLKPWRDGGLAGPTAYNLERSARHERYGMYAPQVGGTHACAVDFLTEQTHHRLTLVIWTDHEARGRAVLLSGEAGVGKSRRYARFCGLPTKSRLRRI
jgi:hypothetical protein